MNNKNLYQQTSSNKTILMTIFCVNRRKIFWYVWFFILIFFSSFRTLSLSARLNREKEEVFIDPIWHNLLNNKYVLRVIPIKRDFFHRIFDQRFISLRWNFSQSPPPPSPSYSLPHVASMRLKKFKKKTNRR